MSTLIEAVQLRKEFGGFTAVDDLSFPAFYHRLPVLPSFVALTLPTTL
jgi:hypothetical protein